MGVWMTLFVWRAEAEDLLSLHEVVFVVVMDHSHELPGTLNRRAASSRRMSSRLIRTPWSSLTDRSMAGLLFRFPCVFMEIFLVDTVTVTR